MDDELEARLRASEPLLWINQNKRPVAEVHVPVQPEQVREAEQNWRHLAPLLKQCFADLEASNGVIASELHDVPELARSLGYNKGRFFVKGDHALPVAGSVKARGGVYEVFLHGLSLARELGLIAKEDKPKALARLEVKAAFSQYSVAVGSTGNLGLSVGIAARSLGFRAVVL